MMNGLKLLQKLQLKLTSSIPFQGVGHSLILSAEVNPSNSTRIPLVEKQRMLNLDMSFEVSRIPVHEVAVVTEAVGGFVGRLDVRVHLSGGLIDLAAQVADEPILMRLVSSDKPIATVVWIDEGSLELWLSIDMLEELQ